MNNTYNANMYMNTSDLNNIEERVYNLTEEVKTKIFNNNSSRLRKIRVGDNLNSKTLYMFFPRNIYRLISGTDVRFITTTNGYFTYTKRDMTITYRYSIDMYTGENRKNLYLQYGYYSNPNMCAYIVKCPYDMGEVTSISRDDPVYQEIYIYDDDDVIPQYREYTWSDNELPTMQEIDNIERGIKNIGKYYYQPEGWIEAKEWIDETGVNTRNISYRDLNRWLTNLDLINFDHLDELTIWNSDITQIVWNGNNEDEWEDL